jgi:hypothetical protein
MAFPSSPSNAQLATVNGIAYQYNSTNNAWYRISNNPSVANLVVTANATVGGNLYITSNAVSGTITRVEYNIPHPFLLMGAS